jgi:hypothetical protein
MVMTTLKSTTFTEHCLKINKDFKTATKDFYKAVKGIRTRTDSHDTTELINDKDGHK